MDLMVLASWVLSGENSLGTQRSGTPEGGGQARFQPVPISQGQRAQGVAKGIAGEIPVNANWIRLAGEFFENS